MGDSMRCNGITLSRREFGAFSASVATGLVFGIEQAYAEEPADALIFVDSLGRSHSFLTPISKILPKGVCAQTLISTLAPTDMISVATDISEDADEFPCSAMASLDGLPIIASDEVSDSLLRVSVKDPNTLPDLILEAGLPKEGLEKELEALQEKTGVPVVFIDLSFGKLPTAYRKLGELLVCHDRAEKLAVFVEKSLEETKAVFGSSENVPHIFYAPKEDGLQVRSGIHAQMDAISHIGASAVTCAYDFADRQVKLPALKQEEIDLIVFDDEAVSKPLANWEGDLWETWSSIPAIKMGKYAVSPALMNSWFGSLIHVQSIGIQWLVAILDPQHMMKRFCQLAVEYYSVFYGLLLDPYEIDELTGFYNVLGE